MIKVTVPIRGDQTKTEYILEYGKDDISYHPYELGTCRRKGCDYLNTINAFDIETTTVSDGDKHEGFMYLWQFCYDNGQVIIGRTWNEFINFTNKLISVLNITLKHRLVIYVHNLYYEFQFMRRFFEWDSVFAVGSRKVVRCVTTGGLEFRCSYKLSNMGLERFTENSKNCIHIKRPDIMNYHVIRTPSTELDNDTLAYSYNDVKGLCEALTDYMEEDTLATIPLTSTGFVRRECRENMKTNPKNRWLLKDMALSEDVYRMVKEAMRGGNTHGNRMHAGKVLEGVRSFDAVSSYPYVQLTKYFPVTGFRKTRVRDMADFKKLTNRYCCLFRVCLENVVLKSTVPVPYISLSKCLKSDDAELFNGRVLSARFLYMTVTEIDWKIIEKQYDIEHIYIKTFYVAARGKLPKEMRDTIRDFFIKKCELKNGDPYYYMKSKNKLNGIFGMSCTDIVRESYEYVSDEWVETEDVDIAEQLERYYKSWNSFLSYQWGLYTTAHARAHLQRMLDITGIRTVYCDTDSDKFFGDFDKEISELNADIRRESENAGAFCDVNGKRYYLGIFEEEKPYDRFITLGAKKYAYEQDGVLGVTVSGVNKKLGGKELGKLENFKPGFVFHEAGGNTLWYNDDPIHILDVNGEKILTASNIGMEESTYKLGYTKEFGEILNLYLDI